jgi:hypothetical protein
MSSPGREPWNGPIAREKVTLGLRQPAAAFFPAVATVTLPALARAANDGIGPDFGPALGRGLRLVGFLVLPCTIGLVVLAQPIISLLYGAGRSIPMIRCKPPWPSRGCLMSGFMPPLTAHRGDCGEPVLPVEIEKP